MNDTEISLFLANFSQETAQEDKILKIPFSLSSEEFEQVFWVTGGLLDV